MHEHNNDIRITMMCVRERHGRRSPRAYYYTAARVGPVGGRAVRARNNETRKYSPRKCVIFAVRGITIIHYHHYNIPLGLTAIVIRRRTVPYRRAVSPELIVRAPPSSRSSRPIPIVFYNTVRSPRTPRRADD